MKRRTLLIGAGATVGLAGCYALGDEGEDGSNRTDPNSQNPTNPNNSTTHTSDTNPGGTDESTNSTPGNQTEDTTAPETNETANTTEQERQPLPDENDTAIDRGQYNSSTERSVDELPSENVQLSATFNEQKDGSIIVSGKATNLTSQPIDFVDIQVLYYDSNQNVIGEDLVVVHELEAGGTKPWDCQTWATEIDGDVANVGGIPHPQNYA